ncbi:AraC-like DNA-binding protein [Bradyrhizobium liaoningense]|nr:hypothetical protein GCM10007858_45330 [Bradyrhizobium liaoningense]
MIIFSPALSDRGWFDHVDALAHVANRPALLHTRQLLLDILRTASVQPGLFETTEVAAHLQEGLLLALDDLFRIDSIPDRSTSVQGERAIKLVQRIDDYVATYPTMPIYTADLARAFGVSIRTLGGAVSMVRGMSLHQYIRLKKLWATRSRLLKGGGVTVATCARAHGFHHLGEFAAAYRAIFHEAPSDTLSRGRRSSVSAG